MSSQDYLAFVEDIIEAIDKFLRHLDTVDGLRETKRGLTIMASIHRPASASILSQDAYASRTIMANQ